MAPVFLIRHGQPDGSPGSHDPGLCDAGRAQAAASAKRLATLPAPERPQRIVSSPSRRCLETAAPLARALGVQVELDAGLGEISRPPHLRDQASVGWMARAAQGRWAEIEGECDYDAWRLDIGANVQRRARTAIFTHFVAINAAVSAALEDERVLHFRPDYASITVMDTVDGKLRLICKGDEAATMLF